MNKSILINSPIGYTGYGVVGWNIAKELYGRKDIDLTVFPISVQKFGDVPKLDSEEESKQLHDMVVKNFDPKGTCIKIWHQFDLAERIGTGKYIAFPFFELDTFNPRELIHLKVPDRLIVASQWAKDILINQNINSQIDVVPLGVNTDIFDHNICKDKNDDDPYIFMVGGKWEIRKAYDVLLQVFTKAFTKDDNVELWIAASSDKTCFSEKELTDWHNYYLTSPLKDKITIIPRVKTQKDVAEKMSRADCGIFLSRAEGWNLELLEMMSMGKPIITTNYSAHTEFCNKDNANLIDITELEPAYDGKWFFGTGNWAKLGDSQLDHAVELMRQMYKAKTRKNPEGIKTGQKFSWKNSVDQLLKCI
jgi:glycosyltransferase involved in cell wall biosynthesis